MLREIRDFGDAKGNLTVHGMSFEMTSAPIDGDRNSKIVVYPEKWIQYPGFEVFKHSDGITSRNIK